jgi:hypothetical protein
MLAFTGLRELLFLYVSGVGFNFRQPEYKKQVMRFEIAEL